MPVSAARPEEVVGVVDAGKETNGRTVGRHPGDATHPVCGRCKVAVAVLVWWCCWCRGVAGLVALVVVMSVMVVMGEFMIAGDGVRVRLRHGQVGAVGSALMTPIATGSTSGQA